MFCSGNSHASPSGMCPCSTSSALKISQSDLLMVHCACASGGQLMGPKLDLLGTIFTFKSSSHGGEFRTGGDKLGSQHTMPQSVVYSTSKVGISPSLPLPVF